MCNNDNANDWRKGIFTVQADLVGLKGVGGGGRDAPGLYRQVL